MTSVGDDGVGDDGVGDDDVGDDGVGVVEEVSVDVVGPVEAAEAVGVVEDAVGVVGDGVVLLGDKVRVVVVVDAVALADVWVVGGAVLESGSPAYKEKIEKRER